MLLYHCFSRVRNDLNNREIDRESLNILNSILGSGLLCTYEKIKVAIDPEADKEIASDTLGLPQSRCCFTLLNFEEIAKPLKRSLFQTKDEKSHVELFGDIGIGIDPIKARVLGILPTIYFAPIEHSEIGIAGLSTQFLYRLIEAREVFAALAYVEAKVGFIDYPEGRLEFPNIAKLEEDWGINLSHEGDLLEKLVDLSRFEAKKVLDLFEVDRIRAAGLFDFMSMLLSAFQTADSSFINSPLEFFAQREWRLLHHNRLGMSWLSIDSGEWHGGPPKAFQKECAEEAQRIIRSKIITKYSEPKSNSILKNTWMLCEVDGKPIQQYFQEIICPTRLLKEVKTIVSNYAGCSHIQVRAY